MAGTRRQKMGYKGRAKKRDANEPEIIKALEAIPGCTVCPLDKPLDLLVGFEGVNYILEVKNPDGKNRLEPDQDEFINTWLGLTPAIVRSVDDAYKAIGFGVNSLHGVRIAR